MNAYEIDKNPLMNGGIKKVARQQTHTEVDIQTGEITRHINVEDGYVGKEPDYIKIYTDCMLVVNGINTALSPFIIAFARYMTFANFSNPAYRCTVRTDKMIREDVALNCGVSDRRVQQAIKELIESELFIPIIKDGKKLRGVYFVNPWVVGKGEWKDIKALRGEFEFVQGASSVLAIDSEGKRKVVMPLTQKKNKQIELKL